MSTQDLQTRDRILKAAFGLFLQIGYENTSVQAIIDAVGIAKGTYYHHFKGKEEMLVVMIEQMSRRVADALDRVGEYLGVWRFHQRRALELAFGVLVVFEDDDVHGWA